MLNTTRKRRLLLIAGKPIDHKPYYSQYCELIAEGLCGWAMGWAYRTEAGNAWLQQSLKMSAPDRHPGISINDR